MPTPILRSLFVAKTPETIVLQRFQVCIFFPHTRNVKLTKYYIKKLRKCRKSHGLDIIYKNLVSLNFKAFSKYLV